jgi:hypothetical protein
MRLKSSPAIWPDPPFPPEEKYSVSGFAFAVAIRSFTDSTRSEGVVTSRKGACAICTTGAKSLIESNGSS